MNWHTHTHFSCSLLSSQCFYISAPGFPFTSNYRFLPGKIKRKGSIRNSPVKMPSNNAHKEHKNKIHMDFWAFTKANKSIMKLYRILLIIHKNLTWDKKKQIWFNRASLVSSAQGNEKKISSGPSDTSWGLANQIVPFVQGRRNLSETSPALWVCSLLRESNWQQLKKRVHRLIHLSCSPKLMLTNKQFIGVILSLCHCFDNNIVGLQAATA